MPTPPCLELQHSAGENKGENIEAVEAIVSSAMESANANYNNQINSLNQYYETIISNRTELNPPVAEDIEDETEDTEVQEEALTSDMLK